jgi:ATP-dependent DNA helicase RecQ
METILGVKEKFKVDHIIDIVTGKETEEVISHCHEQLKGFNRGSNHDRPYWSALIRQAMLEGYIEKEVENYGLLRITKKGKAYLKEPSVFFFLPNNEFEDYEPEPEEEVGALDENLMKMLVKLRRQRAQDLGIPPYVIFQENSLSAMASTYPITIEELQNMPGVGKGKAIRYGKEFCELIAKYCKENEIERPLDLRIRTVASRSKNKISIIEKIDRKLMLDDIANSMMLDMDELLDEMEAIVSSGTKLDINYYLDEVMDEDYMLDIYDYFHDESQTDDLKTAMKELGPDYDERDIRLVRLKFMSEIGN